MATVLTMFFLTTYGMLNLAAGLEELIKDPSYRPRIRVPWWVSFLGAAGCFVAMAAINFAVSVGAIVLESALWYAINRRAMRAAWGDLRTGLWFALARFSMLKLRDANHDPRNWRPHILVFAMDLSRSLGMVRMANNFSQGRGIVTVSTLLLGDVEEHGHAEELVAANRALLAQHDIQAFCEVAAVPDLAGGMVTVMQANGLAGLESNMAMFGWPGEDAGRLGVILGLVRKLSGLEKSSMIVRPVPGSRRRGSGEIVVWWKGRENNGDLMLLLAHLLSLSNDWAGARIALKSVVDSPEMAVAVRQGFAAMLPQIRIDASVDVLIRGGDESYQQVIRRHSERADLIFLGLALPEPGHELAYAEGFLELLDGLPHTILVRNAGPFRGQLV